MLVVTRSFNGGRQLRQGDRPSAMTHHDERDWDCVRGVAHGAIWLSYTFDPGSIVVFRKGGRRYVRID